MNYALIFSLIISTTIGIRAAYDVQFLLADDLVIKQYVHELYEGALDADPIYILTQPSTLFFEGQDGQSTIYFSTGYVGPRFKVSEDQCGTYITYGTYFLLHELYLEYLLEHPEVVVFEDTDKEAAQIAKDLQTGKLSSISPVLVDYLVNICGDGEFFVERATHEYCTYPSTIVKKSNENGAQYIVSPLLGEMLFRRAQKDHFIAEAFDDIIYLSRVFNDRSHWTALTDEQETFFNVHKDDPVNGGFLSDMQVSILFQEFLKKGMFAGIYQRGCDIYVDISGFMVGNYRHAILVCNTDSDKPTFIMSPFLIHLISAHQAEPFFEKLTPVVAETLKNKHNSEQY